MISSSRSRPRSLGFSCNPTQFSRQPMPFGCVRHACARSRAASERLVTGPQSQRSNVKPHSPALKLPPQHWTQASRFMQRQWSIFTPRRVALSPTPWSA